MDPSVPDVDESVFSLNTDWKDFYWDPHRMLEPLRKPLYVGCFIDADYSDNFITRRPHSGILLFVNNALIKYFRKRQNTVKSSTFGSELFALRIARETIVEIIIKLKTTGVPLAGPANVFGDNNGAAKNIGIPEYTLSKEHNVINYHCVREVAASGILRVGKEDTETNLPNPFKKFLPYYQKQ